MKKILISFGNKDYYKSLNRISEQAYEFKIFDEIIMYDDKYLENNNDFWSKHKDFILENKRGFGYWIWKSFITLKTLEKMEYGDVLLYVDAGCILNIGGKKRLLEYYDILSKSEHDLLSFELSLREKSYTKMDLFKFLSTDIEDIESNQLVGGIFFIKKTKKSVLLIEDWYNLMCNYKLIDDSESVSKNMDFFIEHRHDQSAFSLLRKKYGTHIIKDETYFYKWDENKIKDYPILARRSRV